MTFYEIQAYSFDDLNVNRALGKTVEGASGVTGPRATDGNIGTYAYVPDTYRPGLIVRLGQVPRLSHLYVDYRHNWGFDIKVYLRIENTVMMTWTLRYHDWRTNYMLYMP